MLIREKELTTNMYLINTQLVSININTININ